MSNALKLSFGVTKRAFTVAVVVTTMLWSVAASFAIAPRAAHAAASVAAGDLVKGSLPAVYYVGSDGKRYVFTNDKAYSTWYANFSSVKTISDTDLASIMIGGNVTYRPGVKMVKIQSDPKVYAVAHGGVLRWVSTEAAAVALYGSDWNKKIDDIADAFFVNYTVGTQISSASDYTVANEQTLSPTINSDKGLTGSGSINVSLASDNPAGATVTKNAQGINLLKFNVAGTGTVSGLTFTRQGAGVAADWSNIYLYDGSVRLTTGRSVSSSTNQVAFSNLNLAVSGTKTLTLVGDLPTAGATVGNASNFALVAATDVVSGGTVGGSFPVSGNTFTISGTSSGTLTLDDGSTPSDAKLGATGAELANFKMSAGSGEDVSVRRIVVTNSGAGSLTNLANLSIQTGGTVIAQNPIISGSTATFTFAVPYVLGKGVTRSFTVNGDILPANRPTIDTYKLYVDQTYDVYATGNTYGAGVNVTNNFGTSAANIVNILGGQITFAFNGPTTGDISLGANDAVLNKFAITAANRVEVRNLRMQIDAGSALTGNIDKITDCKVKNADTGMTVTNQVDLSGWTEGAGTDVVFNKTFTDRFEIAAGQTLNLALTCDILSTGTGLSGIALKGTVGARLAGDFRNLDSNLDVAVTDIVPASALAGNNQTVRTAGLTVGLSASPASQTVTKGSTVNALGINFTAGAASDVKVSQMKFRAMMTIDADATTFAASESGVTDTATHTVQDMVTSVTIWDGSTQLGTAQSPDSNGDVNFTNLAWTVPAGTTKTITVKALLSNNLPYGTGTNKILIDLIGDGTAQVSSYGKTANVTAVDKDSNAIDAKSTGWSNTDYHLQAGDTVTAAATMTSNASSLLDTVIGSGTMTIQLDGDTPVAGIVTANTTDNSVTRIKFNSVNEGFNVTRLTVENTTAAASRSITSVRLFDKNGTLFCSGALDSANRLRCANDAGLFTVANDNVVTVKVNVDQEGSGTSGAVSGDAPVMAFYVSTSDGIYADDIKAIGVSSGAALVDANADDTGSTSITVTGMSGALPGTAYVSGNAQTIRKTQPTIAAVATTTSLINGQNTLNKFSVTAASNADVSLRQVTLKASISGTLTADGIQVFENGVALDGANYDVTNAAGTSLKASATSIGAGADWGVIVKFTTERVVAAGTTKTYELKVNVAGADAGESLSSYIEADSAPNLVVTGTVAGVKTNTTSKIIWSDNSADVHSANSTDASTSTDWANGYLVKTLPTTTQTISR